MADIGGRFLENWYDQFMKDGDVTAPYSDMVAPYIVQYVGFLAFRHQPLVALIAPTLLIEGVFRVQN